MNIKLRGELSVGITQTKLSRMDTADCLIHVVAPISLGLKYICYVLVVFGYLELYA